MRWRLDIMSAEMSGELCLLRGGVRGEAAARRARERYLKSTLRSKKPFE